MLALVLPVVAGITTEASHFHAVVFVRGQLWSLSGRLSSVFANCKACVIRLGFDATHLVIQGRGDVRKFYY